MNDIFDFFAKNKEWIFSGIGVSIISAIAYLIVSHITRRSLKSPVPAAIEPNQNSIIEYRRYPLPSEIVKEIDKLPILQRDAVAENYIGLKVEWKTTLHSAHHKGSNIVHIMMLDRGSYPWIYCDIDISQYPEMKIAKEGQKLLVQGRIASIKGNNVTLIDPVIRLE